MGLLGKYIAQYKFSFILFGIWTGIFAAVFYLCKVRVDAVLYAAELCLAAAGIALIIKFVLFAKRYKENQKLIENIAVCGGRLPKGGSPLEEQYLMMTRKLLEINTQMNGRNRREHREGMDFNTAWAHQIKTPISVMQMQLRAEDTAANRELLAQLFRIEQYTEMILCRYRLDSGCNDLVIENLPLDNVIRSAVRKYAPLFIQKKIGLDYGGTDEIALTDKKWLGFILEQLLSNAVKYTERGKVTVTVRDKVITVEDSGIGIAAEDMPRIFEKGYTGYNGREDKRSTGLGLYLCRQAADRLSHRISAVSQPGEGSIFRIDLNTDGVEIE